tara:strand:- start:1528 stop:3477 length:1950 start_codon:yes stop_codon:yes gene_type:complete
MAYSQNMQDLQKLKSQYEKFESEKNQLDIQNSPDQSFDKPLGIPVDENMVPYAPPSFDISLDTISNYFGYNFFTLRDTIPFWDNLPPPANYILGPGDEIIISLWGETELRQEYAVSRDGNIYVEKVGLLNIMGKSIEDARKYLLDQFGRIYSTLKGPMPSTYMDISLGQLRSININIVGEVNYPGLYPVHPFSTPITSLIQAGGVKTTGSLRKIEVKRNNTIISKIDLYDYLINGNLPNDIQLRDQDVIIVPIRASTVTIDSSILRPGIYEAMENETVYQMIDYAGGTTWDASHTIGLKRFIPFNNRKFHDVSTENYYIDYRDSKKISIQDGDIITIQKIFPTLNQVEIIGQVKNPGIYYFNSGMRLKDLIDLSGGLSDTTFWKSVFQTQGELVRRNPNSRYETIIKINLNGVINNDESQNIALQNLDRFVVHANLNFFEKENVQILGEVNIPGSYPLISDKETLASLLSRAGGLTTKALDDGISIYRNKEYFASNSLLSTSIDMSNKEFQNQEDSKIRVAWQNQSIALMPGDSVVVKEASMTINILGEVYNPGLIEYKDGKSLNYYVNAAGGVTDLGNKSNIIVIYANGVVSPKRWYKSPKVEDGASIIVNQKEIIEPFNVTEFATNWTSIISSVITIVILSRQVGNG